MDGRERNLARYSTKGAGVAGKGVLLLIKKLMVFVGVPIFTMGIFLLVLTAGVETEISSMTAVLSNQKSSTSEEAVPDEEISAGAMKDARTSYPKAGNPFFFSAAYNPWVQLGAKPGYHNCTWYAFGRFGEILGKRPTLPTGNAGTWYPNCHTYKKGSTPKVGAVICWYYSTGGAGHVAIVEEVKANGDIVTSNSGWSGTRLFWMQTWTKASGYSGGKFRFQGFIYQP